MTRMVQLTRREREVVALAAHGLSDGEIGTVLALSPTTAKTRVSRAMAKLSARDRASIWSAQRIWLWLAQ